MKPKIWITATLVLAALAVAAFVVVDRLQDRHDADRDRPAGPDIAQETRDGSLVPLAKVLESAAQHVPGEVLKVELEDEHGRRIYEIKVLAANGRVRELKFDAHDAQLIEIEDD
jgi:uncharacterized membrane protein YkoI